MMMLKQGPVVPAPSIDRGTTIDYMDYYAGIDVSLELSSVCVVDASGKVVRESKVASEPEMLLQHFADLELPITRIGLEAGPLSQWLRQGLVEAGLRWCCWKRDMSRQRCRQCR